MFAAVWALIERGSGLEAGGARGPQAFAPATRDLVGIDAERLIVDPSLIAEDYFTETERGHLGDPQTSSRVSTVIWASKEAVSKALGEGLRLSLTSMVVLDPGPLELGVWHPVRVRVDGHPSISLWSWHEEGGIVTVASVPARLEPPVWELRL